MRRAMILVLTGAVLVCCSMLMPAAVAAGRPSATVKPDRGPAGTKVTISAGGFEVDNPHPTESWCPKLKTVCGTAASGPNSGAVFICQEPGMVIKGSSCGGEIPASARGAGVHYIFSYQLKTHLYAITPFTLTG